MSLSIKVYSDYVCPFCYLAEYPLREALRGKQATVEWQPFELRPYPEPTLRPEDDYLQRAWKESVYPLAQQMGVPIVLPPVTPQPHTDLAFEGYQFAKERGKGNEYNHRVFTAFFQEGQDIGKIEALAKLAGELGLDEADFEVALHARRYRKAHQKALRQAFQEVGVTGVPLFEIGNQLLAGLQDRETLEEVIEEELFEQAHPELA